MCAPIPNETRKPETTGDSRGAAPPARLQEIWNRAYAADTPDALRDLYRDWATSYDEDHESVGFFGHRVAARCLARFTPFPDLARVLDAGAGTGAAGEALRDLGFRNLIGTDLSPDMLSVAREKGVYQQTRVADLGWPIDDFPNDTFDAAILVGVFSYGQAPAHSLEEVLRLVKPGGVVTFTMRTDFFEQDAMGVRSVMESLEADHAWKPLLITEPQQYLPGKDPDAMFRVWTYRVLETKRPPVDESFAEAVRHACTPGESVRRIDHAHIWNRVGSRLYDRYTECPDYYLTDSELEILENNKHDILGDAEHVVELGCGSAKKVRNLLEAGISRGDQPIRYTAVDVSAGAVEATCAEVTDAYGSRIEIEPRRGRFQDVLASIPVDHPKLIVFFGGSLGNLETVDDTVEFLRTLRSRMGPEDRFVVGTDLQKDQEILRRAYEAGPANRAFFLNMLRRINNELGGNLDLGAFEQWSPCEPDPPQDGIETFCVQLRLRNTRTQSAYISALHTELELNKGDSFQVGTSRKFRPEDIDRIAARAGLTKSRRWLDRNSWFALTEFLPTGNQAR